MNDDCVESSLKSQVQRQFGQSAGDYATSDVHAQGESLAALREMIPASPAWRVLDIATGAGHTACLFAPHVAEVVALDLTREMLDQTAELAQSRGIGNLATQMGDAEDLPFPDASFDLVTCRLAFHHFPNPDQSVREMFRVLKPAGQLGITDNFTLDDPAAAEFYNHYEKIRDPSHFRVMSESELLRMFEDHGFRIGQTRQMSKEFEFQKWADRQRVSAEDKLRLLKMMKQIPHALQPWLRPRWSSETMYFCLWEIAFVATRG